MLRIAEKYISSSSVLLLYISITSLSIIRMRGCAEDSWGIYQLTLYSINSLSIIRMRGCAEDGWEIYQLIIYPIIYQLIISPVLLHLSLSSGWKAVLRMAEEYISAHPPSCYISFHHHDERLCWGWLMIYHLRMTWQYISFALQPLMSPSFLRMKKLCWGWLRYGATSSLADYYLYNTAKPKINKIHHLLCGPLQYNSALSHTNNLYNFLELLQWNNVVII
jgi:hypothetical protein